MSHEIVGGSIFAAVAVLSFLYGLKLLTHKDINLAQFLPDYQGNRTNSVIRHKKSQNDLSLPKRVILILVGFIISALGVYAVVGIYWMALVAGLAGLIVPRLWMGWQKQGYKKIMAMQLEQALEIMAAVIRSGGGITAALEDAAQKIGAPLGPEIFQTAKEIELGISFANAFKNLAERVPIHETAMLAMIMEIQQTGIAVNLASVFNQIQTNIRGKQALQEKVRALTVENKLAGFIVGAVPFGTIGLIRWMSPEFVAPIFSSTIGLIVFGISTVSIFAGIVWIMRLSEMSDL